MSEMELVSPTATNGRRSDIAISYEKPGAKARSQNTAFVVADLINTICQEMALDGNTAGRRLSVVQPDLQLTAHGNLSALAATLRLLVRHALLSTAAGSEVRLAIHRIDDRIWIDIADHCGGIAVPASELGALMPRASIGKRLNKMGGMVEPHDIEASGGSIDLYNIPGAGCVWSLSALSVA
jgi:hypothetical protein